MRDKEPLARFSQLFKRRTARKVNSLFGARTKPKQNRKGKKYMGNLSRSRPFLESIIIYTAQSAFSRKIDDATLHAAE